MATNAANRPAAAMENRDSTSAARSPLPERTGSASARPATPPSQTLPARTWSTSTATTSTSGLAARVWPVSAGALSPRPAATSAAALRGEEGVPLPSNTTASATPTTTAAGTAYSDSGSEDHVLPLASELAPPSSR